MTELTNSIQSKTKLTFLQIAVVILALVAGLSTFLLRTSTANAAGPQYITTTQGITVAACKTYVEAYGGVYQITALFTKAPETAPKLYYLASVRNGVPVVGQTFSGTAYWNNQVAALQTNASAYYQDAFVISVDGKYNAGGPTTWSTGLISPIFLHNC